IQLSESNNAIQMENFLSLLESVDPLWLTPSSTTWAMVMIFAFACGLGFFHLLLPLLPFDSPSPPPAESITTKKVVKREPSKVRKRIRTVKAYRGHRKKPKEDKVLVLRLHSMLERLVSTISFCQLLGQDVSGEAFTPDAAKAHLPPRQPTEESVATSSSLETSSAPRNGHLLIKDSKPLWPVLLNSSPIESQSSLGLALTRTQELTQRALPRYWSDLELTVVGKVALLGGGSRRGGTAAGQSEGEIEPGFADEGASCGKLGSPVAGLERGGGGGTAGSQRPPGHGPRALPALGYSQRPARDRL
ncbi:Spermatogenesis-associated protein 31, partial [Microtus ochrogaster]